MAAEKEMPKWFIAEPFPFHDLKAQGCFSPPKFLEGGSKRGRISPEELTKRPSGSGMRTLLHTEPAYIGCGGKIIPEDSEPLPPVQTIKRSAKPWTSTGTHSGLFSRAPYVTCPPADPVRPPVEPPFHTGASGSTLGVPYPYLPEERVKEAPPRNFRFKTGKSTFPTISSPQSPDYSNPMRSRTNKPSDSPSPSKRKEAIIRQPFADSKNWTGTLGRLPKYLPEPYVEKSLRPERQFRVSTFSPKSKCSVPIAVPWSSGIQTAEPVFE